MEFFPEVMISHEEGALMARGMLAVARSDGNLHDREITLVQGFLGAAGGSPFALNAFSNEDDIGADVLAAGLTRDAIGMLFIKSCILLAYADGVYAPAEKAKIEAYAAALDISGDAIAELEQSVREFLLSQLHHVQDTAAVVQVARELNES